VNEFELIERFFDRPELTAAGAEVALGIGDDAAVLQLAAGTRLCLSMDSLVAGVHFPAEATAYDIASRALAVNLSDLAAMAAQPLCFTLALSLPEHDGDWLAQFSDGLASVASRHHCALIGGDLVRGPLTVTIQVHGSCLAEPLLRSGAKAGDSVVVTGWPGRGALSLLALGVSSHLGEEFKLVSALAEADRMTLHQKFYSPEPRLALARQARSLLHAGIDVSDGLAADLGHMARASGLVAEIELSALPQDPLLSNYLDSEQRERAILYGGDDYELCLAVPPQQTKSLLTLADKLAVPCAVIGSFREPEDSDQPGVMLIDASGEAKSAGSAYSHF
jgi:thiamine-monophosphate kinase